MISVTDDSRPPTPLLEHPAGYAGDGRHVVDPCSSSGMRMDLTLQLVLTFGNMSDVGR
jgi:hypothetical protein